MESAKLKINKKDFITWLKSKKDKQFVGRVISACECPIASFLKETEKDKTKSYEVFTVSTNLLVNGIITKFLYNPEWVNKFVEEVTNMKGLQNSMITKEKALEVIENL